MAKLTTKQAQYEALSGHRDEIVKALKDSGLELTNEIKNAVKAFDKTVEDEFKPQKGGGASANPMQVIDGENYHYCRYLQDYVIEADMVMSGGKSKGASQAATKLNYDLQKKIKELNAEIATTLDPVAVAEGDMSSAIKCGELKKLADDITKSLTMKETYSEEALAPYWAKIRGEKEQTTEEAPAETEAESAE